MKNKTQLQKIAILLGELAEVRPGVFIGSTRAVMAQLKASADLTSAPFWIATDTGYFQPIFCEDDIDSLLA